MPHPILLTALSDNWAYMAPFLASALALMTGYVLSIMTSRRAAIASHDTETVNEKKAWRAAQMLAVENNKEAIQAEKSERIQWQLKREAESAMVVGILEENAVAQKLLAGIVSTTRHLEGGQARNEQDIRDLRGHISAIQTQLLNLAQSRHAHS